MISGRSVPEPHISSEGDHLWEKAFDTARAFIHCRYEEDECVVSIGEVLEHLDEALGEAAGLTSDVTAVLHLCTELWADPHIDQVDDGFIDFCWNEEGDWPRECSQGLLARLQGRSDREEPR